MSGARSIGSILLVEPGVAVWSTRREREIPGGTKPIGGCVVDHEDRVDTASGETVRRFICVDHEDPHHPMPWFEVTEDEVDRDLIVALDVSKIVKLWRRLADEVRHDKRGHERTGLATKDEAERAIAIGRLVELVVGPTGPLYALLQLPKPQAPTPPRPTAPVNVAAFVD